MSIRRALRVYAVALLSTPALALAQGPLSTGLGPIGGADPNYQISVNGGAFSNAFVLNRTTGPTTFAGASASGSLPGGAADGFLNRFAYSFRTTFTGGTVTAFTYQCAIDDVFTSVMLNGSVVAGAGCNQYDFGSTFSVGGVLAGSNTLVFNGGGNGITDGLAVRITGVTVSAAPEPSTWVLMGTGLLALSGVAARRRSRAG